MSVWLAKQSVLLLFFFFGRQKWNENEKCIWYLQSTVFCNSCYQIQLKGKLKNWEITEAYGVHEWEVQRNRVRERRYCYEVDGLCYASFTLRRPYKTWLSLRDHLVLFRPAQTTMPSRPLKKEIRTRKFLKGASIYKQVYAKKTDIVSIGEYAEVRQANHTATETHETSRKCITSKIQAHLFWWICFSTCWG